MASSSGQIRLFSSALDDDEVRLGLSEHLAREFRERVEINSLERKSPGFSWITFSFVAHFPSGRSRKLILRLAPPNGLFAPYSVLPQVHALKAMVGTKVPAPALVSFDEEGQELGLPFFICEFVAGNVPAPWASASDGGLDRRKIACEFIDILARIHTVRWEQTQLANLESAVPDGHRRVAHIDRWRASLDRPMRRHYPVLDWGGRWLAENCPKAPRWTVVHGDYRIGNFLVADNRITAILDWELVHLGDPHEDLGWALIPTFNGGSRKLYGLLDHSEVVEKYEAASGIKLSVRSLAFYRAYALYQAAAIQMRAIRAFEIDRFNDMRMAVIGTQMASIVRAFDRALEAAA